MSEYSDTTMNAGFRAKTCETRVEPHREVWNINSDGDTASNASAISGNASSGVVRAGTGAEGRLFFVVNLPIVSSKKGLSKCTSCM